MGPPRFKELYKPVPSSREVRQRRLSHEQQLRRLHREQVFMGKRLCFRTPQESETESEYEFTPSDTAEIINGLKSGRHEERVAALTTLSTKLEQPSEALQRFVRGGECTRLLVEIVNGVDRDEKLQSLWCLTNIAGGEDAALAETALEAVPHMVALIESSDGDLQNQAIWAVGNLAAEGEGAREQLRANGVVEALAAVLAHTQDAQVLQTACFAMSNLARRPSSYFDGLFALGVPEAVAGQLQRVGGDAGCVGELAWVCAYLTAGSSAAQLDAVLRTGAVDSLLASSAQLADARALIPVVRTLGNVAAGTDAQTHALVARPGFVAALLRGVDAAASRAVEKETLWVLASVTAAGRADVDAVVRAGVVPRLERIVARQAFDIRKEAARCLLNIAMAGRLRDLPNAALLPRFAEFVASHDDEL
ncbi:hypothetical protein LPJ70_006224, partial [Coemansia sp. RSA 2708]